MRTYRRYLAGFAVLALVLLPALIPLAEADLDGPRLDQGDSPAAAALKADIANVRILGVNDLHGNLLPPVGEGVSGVGGVAYLDAHMDLYERVQPGRTIRVHAGDMVGGSPLVSSHFHDEPTVNAMNETGFDVGTLGNHEFDEGGEEMLRLLTGGQRADGGRSSGGRDASDPRFAGTSFPYVAANTLRVGSGEPGGVPVLPPHAVLERDGVRIGFVGVVTPDTAQALMPEAAAPFRFLDMSEAVNRSVEELRGEGVEAIVVLAHSGDEEILRETAEMGGAVDVVLAGHTHSVMNERVGGRLVVEAAEYGTAFSVVDLRVDRRTGEVREADAEVVPVRHDAVRPDPALSDLIARSEEEVKTLSGRVVAEAAMDAPLAGNASGESTLGDLVADAQRSAAGADVAFVHTAGLRTGVMEGPVTYGELFAAQPFGDEVVRMDLSGRAVLRLLEQQYRENGPDNILQVSGLRYVRDHSRPEGRRVTGVTLRDGAPLDPEETYTVASDAFLASGGGGFSTFREGQDRSVVGRDVELLASYIGELPQPFVAPDPRRETRISPSTSR